MAEVIFAVSRDLARSIPPPHGAPFFCLDAGVVYDLRVLETLAQRGIFRKYETVLEIGCELGGRARWLAAELGCRMVGVDARLDAIRGAASLNRRAHMSDQVTFHVGQSDGLPFRERLFTHVWILNDAITLALPVLTEAFRVLRRGGYFGVHLHGSVPPGLVEMMTAVGFVDVGMDSIGLSERGHAMHLAQARLDAFLRARGCSSEESSTVDLPVHLVATQVVARRPA